MLKACGLTLACWLLSAAVLGALVYQRVRDPGVIAVAALTGGFVAMMGWMCLFGIPRVLRERASIRAGIDGEPLPDGKLTAAVGRVVALGTKIHAPFTQTSCVLYEYEIYRLAQKKTLLFKGLRMVPCGVQTRMQTVRLLAHTKLKFPPNNVEGTTALMNAREYTRTTTFRQMTIENVRKMLEEIKGLYSDDDGDIRTDDKLGDWADGPDVKLSETVLAPGEEVCAIGYYSSQRGGMVPHEGEIHSIHVYKGSPERVLRSFGWKAVRYFLLAVVFLGAVVAAAIAFWRFFPEGSFG